MEQNKVLVLSSLENVNVLESTLLRFNSIYKRNLSVSFEKKDSLEFFDFEELNPNDIFTLGGFYGTALFKERKES